MPHLVDFCCFVVELGTLATEESAISTGPFLLEHYEPNVGRMRQRGRSPAMPETMPGPTADAAVSARGAENHDLRLWRV